MPFSSVDSRLCCNPLFRNAFYRRDPLLDPARPQPELLSGSTLGDTEPHTRPLPVSKSIRIDKETELPEPENPVAEGILTVARKRSASPPPRAARRSTKTRKVNKSDSVAATVCAAQRQWKSNHKVALLRKDFEEVPPIISTSAVPGTVQWDFEEFARDLFSALRKPRLITVWADLRTEIHASSLIGKRDVLKAVADGMVRLDLLGKPFDFDVISARRAIETGPGQRNVSYDENLSGSEVRAKIRAALRSPRGLPLWVKGFVDGSESISAEEILRDVSKYGLRAPATATTVNPPVEVFDGGLPVKAQNPRPMRSGEFKRYIIEGEIPVAPLNWLALKVPKPHMSITPSVVKSESLLEASGPRRNREWMIASTPGAISPLHRDKLGFLTWVMPVMGSKTWIIPGKTAADGSGLTDEELKAFGPTEVPLGAEFVGKVMDDTECKGLWIQGPGQAHSVYTNETSIFVGGHFLTAAHFHLTLMEVLRTLQCPDAVNEDCQAEDFSDLSSVLDHIDDTTTFTDEEHARVGQVAWWVGPKLRDEVNCPLTHGQHTDDAQGTCATCPRECAFRLFALSVVWVGSQWEGRTE